MQLLDFLPKHSDPTYIQWDKSLRKSEKLQERHDFGDQSDNPPSISTTFLG